MKTGRLAGKRGRHFGVHRLAVGRGEEDGCPVGFHGGKQAIIGHAFLAQHSFQCGHPCGVIIITAIKRAMLAGGFKHGAKGFCPFRPAKMASLVQGDGQRKGLAVKLTV